MPIATRRSTEELEASLCLRTLLHDRRVNQRVAFQHGINTIQKQMTHHSFPQEMACNEQFRQSRRLKCASKSHCHCAVLTIQTNLNMQLLCSTGNANYSGGDATQLLSWSLWLKFALTVDTRHKFMPNQLDLLAYLFLNRVCAVSCPAHFGIA